MLYKYALDHLPKSRAKDVYVAFVSFEKTRGGKGGVDDVVIAKRRFGYEEAVKVGGGASRKHALSPSPCEPN
jgi:crooked neck